MADETNPYGELPYVMSGLGRRRSNPYDRQRQMGYAMMQSGMDMSPVAHPLQGASRLAQALVGSLMASSADARETEADKQRQAEFGRIATIADPQERLAAYGKLDPEFGMKVGAQMAMQEAAQKRNAEMFQNGGAQIAAGYNMQPQGGGQGFTMPPEQAKATAQQYAKYLIDSHGFTPEQAASMVGNLYQESGFNPNAVHDNGTGFGLGGWRLDRRDALLNFAQQTKRDPRDPQTQLDFYATELKSRPEFAQFQQAQDPTSRQAALMTYFRPAGWTPQTPQSGDGFNNRLQFGQTFMPGQSGGSQAQMPIPQPPGAAPQGGPPAIPNVKRPLATPELIADATAKYQAGLFGKDPLQAQAGARQYIEQQIDRQWDREQKAADMEYQQRVGDYKDQRTRAENAPKQSFESAMQLRKEYSSEPIVKQYRTVIPMLETAQDAVTRPTRAADINLVYAFAKLMDPDSVVRESETGMVTATGTIRDKIGSYLGQLNGGPMLKPETRANLIRELEARLGPMQESYNQITDAYGKIADSGGIPREHVMLPIRQSKPGAPAAPDSGAQTIKTPRGSVTIQRVP